MTPEFSRQAGLVLDSPYFHSEELDEDDQIDLFITRHKELAALKDAVVVSNSYDDLDDEAKEIWDRAEQANREFEEFANSDVEGYGRFLDDRTARAAPIPPPELADADSDESAVPAPSLEEEPE